MGDLGNALSLNEGKTNIRDKRTIAINQRIEEVQSKLGSALYPTLAIIELDGKDEFNGIKKGSDPKAALRIGFARTRRHSQFLATNRSSNSPLLERIRKAYLDGLRHLGIRPFSPVIQDMAQPLRYCALSFIVQNRQTSHTGKKRIIPILVYMIGDTGEVFAYVEKEGEKDSGSWLPYSKALLAFADGNIKTFERDDQAFGYIHRLIQKVLPDGDLIIICEASKTRRFWTWWQNKTITRDAWALNPGAYRPIENTPNLRLVRLRGGADGETPHGYALGEGEQIGFTEGLFKHSERVYYSIQSKPKQFPLSPNMSKLERWSLADGSTTTDPRPDKPGWNPTLYEIVVAAIQKGDRPELIAALIHELRKASVQFDEATALPVPLHLANLMEEYILESLVHEDDDE